MGSLSWTLMKVIFLYIVMIYKKQESAKIGFALISKVKGLSDSHSK